MKYPKRPPVRDPRYLAWLRTLSCTFCGALPPNEASHHGNTGGVGLKASDHDALPACRRCHQRWHNQGSPRWDWDHLTTENKRERLRKLAHRTRSVWTATTKT